MIGIADGLTKCRRELPEQLLNDPCQPILYIVFFRIDLQVLCRNKRMMPYWTPDERFVQLPKVGGRPIVVKIHVVHDVECYIPALNEYRQAPLPHPIVKHCSPALLLPEPHPIRQVVV